MRRETAVMLIAFCLSLTLGLYFVGVPQPSAAASFLVTSNADSGPGTLRQAMLDANASAGLDTIRIEFDGEITLTEPLPILIDAVRIQASDAGRVTLRRADDAPPFRLVQIAPAVEATLVGLTLHGGAANNGSGVYSQGILTLIACHLQWNSAQGYGAALYHSGAGALTLKDCLINDNRASASGLGGIVPTSGAGVFVEGAGTDVTQVTMVNTTITQNWAEQGGGAVGIRNASAVLTHVTIAHNRSRAGTGGILPENAEVRVTNSILAGNAPSDCANPAFFTFAGRNLLGHNASTGGCPARGDDLILAGDISSALDYWPGENGGQIQTHALTEDSPALNAGVNAVVPSDLVTDQRGAGFVRIFGAAVDIGAFEVQPYARSTDTPAPPETQTPSATWTLTASMTKTATPRHTPTPYLICENGVCATATWTPHPTLPPFPTWPPTPTATPYDGPFTNAILNPGFEAGFNHWETWNAQAVVHQGQLDLTLNPGAEYGGFYQTVMYPISASTYELRFDVSNRTNHANTLYIAVRTVNWETMQICPLHIPAYLSPTTYFMRLYEPGRYTSPLWYPFVVQAWMLDNGDVTTLRFDNFDFRERPDLPPGYFFLVDCRAEGYTNAELLRNGDFSQDLNEWGFFGSPGQAMLNGSLSLARSQGAPDSGFFQQIPLLLTNDFWAEMRFRIGNISTVPRSLTLAFHTPDWSLSYTCSITVPPQTPLTTRTMRLRLNGLWLDPIVSGWLHDADGERGLLLDDFSLRQASPLIEDEYLECPALLTPMNVPPPALPTLAPMMGEGGILPAAPGEEAKPE